MPKTLENIITYAIYHCAQHRVFGMCVCTHLSAAFVYISLRCVYLCDFALTKGLNRLKLCECFFPIQLLFCCSFHRNHFKKCGIFKNGRVFFILSTHLPYSGCSTKKMCISCPQLEILITRRPVAFSFCSAPKRELKAKKRKKNI